MRTKSGLKWNTGTTAEEKVSKAYDHVLMTRILRYLKPDALMVVLATALLILFSAASVAGPLITG